MSGAIKNCMWKGLLATRLFPSWGCCCISNTQQSWMGRDLLGGNILFCSDFTFRAMPCSVLRMDLLYKLASSSQMQPKSCPKYNAGAMKWTTCEVCWGAGWKPWLLAIVWTSLMCSGKKFICRITLAEKIAYISSAVTQSKGLAAGVNMQRRGALW